MRHHTSRAGSLIRELRKQRRLTGGELGKKVGISQSKISKLESGYYSRLNTEEINSIFAVLRPSKKQQLEIQAALENTLSELKAHRITPPQWRNTSQLEKDARVVRMFMVSLLPAFLQTIEYRKAFLALYNFSAEELVADRRNVLNRQDLLWARDRTFHFILYEACLYACPGSRDTQLAQLDRIERLVGLENVKIGIVPFKPGLPAMPYENFVLYDTHQLIIEAVSFEIVSKDLTPIQDHIKTFTALDKRALYGGEAREIIREAVKYFS